MEILDVGCGMGDMAEAVSGWGKNSGFSIRYKCIDKNIRIIKLAEELTKTEGIEYLQGDLFDKNLPQADIIVASMVFHHFEEEEIGKALEHLLAKSKYALIINDLTRSFALYSICYLLTRFVKNKVSRNDALLSVRKGFRIEEMQTLLDKLKIRGIIKKQFFGRFIVIIAKQ
jgi:2-polyprenyl-3-methyl-5-hydroxy-6-metoxy-1,4-benzoquinol methylase